jgi:uncharacterized membrane protein
MPWLALGYPLLAHLAVILHEQWLQWLALVWLLMVSLSGALLHRRPWAWIVFILGSAALYALVTMNQGLYALYVPPAVIPAALFILFARSLREGETPLVTNVATAIRGEPLPPDLLVYTRHVTQLWCVVCLALFISAVTLAVWASPPLWSLMTNIVHYLVLGAVFVLEFAYRRIRFRHHEHTGLLQYLRRLAQTRIRP